MILSAIVAVAILFLLLQIIGGINTSTNSSPKDAINNALLSAKTSGGSVDTVEFTIDPQGEINSEDFQERSSTLNTLRLRLEEVESALEKIKNNNYGKCEDCADEISEERLNANPAAKTCEVHM